MSDDIYIDRDNVRGRMTEVVQRVDALDDALRDRPPAADGGAASALIGLIAAAGVEAANEYSGAVRLLSAITDDVLDDAFASEQQRTRELARLEARLED
jgi:formiminotetrahydrofolate cyclodeaminase